MTEAVSVVIAAFNQAPFLADAIRSARDQTLGVPHIVVVDDGSTDDTSAVAAAMSVPYVLRKNGGPSAARNTGLDLVDSEYVVFLDADDMLHPRHNEECLAGLQSHPEASYAYSQWQQFGASSDRSEHPSFERGELLYRNYISAASLFRTEVVRSVRWDERLRWGMEDWDLYLSLLSRGHVGVLVDEPLLLYRQRNVGRTATLRAQALRLHSVHLYLLFKHRALYDSAFKARLKLVLAWIWQDLQRARVPR